MNQLFFDESGRLRSGWRAAFFGALYFMAVAVSMALVGAAAANLGLAESPRLSAAVRSVVMVIPAIGLGLLCSRVFEGMGAEGVGVKPGISGLKTFTAGFGVGVLTLLVAVMLAVLLGRLRFELNVIDIGSVTASLAVFAIAAAWEEALFRGYILQTLARSGYAWPAILFTAAFFGLGHAGNPAATGISIANTVLAGVWFGVAYLRTRDLWFVWAMHLAWNWTQGSILGIEVSGLSDLSGTTLLREADAGPTWLTGTAYGIEGSIMATIALAISTIAIHFAPGKKTGGATRFES